ncbi:pseudouridine synthase [Azoarcus sp. L1K30]|uniref:pseudouridine synthase n=1 Tax=Azoarcus sp. L1K30 TaxID=2820277 RepID=UPI0020137C61|nr:pseudouridine synthase [Azoarcus sp. L1K30]
MNSVRKNPPQPAPSRISGTLKAKRQPVEVTPPEAEEVRRKSERDGGHKERRSRDARTDDGRAREAKSSRPAGKPAARESGRSDESGASRRNGDRVGRGQATRESRPHPSGPPLTPRTSTAEGLRLSKVMADRGICSRREADELIERGWVFVDGKRVSALGTRIDPDARIALAPEAKQEQAQRVTILLHKPVGYVSGQPEPGYQPAMALIGSDTQYDRDTAQRFHPSLFKGLAPAGRLDIDSTGLLVFTQDGRIARQLIGENSTVEKEYIVRVEGKLAENGLALLNHGLWLDDRPLREAKVEWINEDQLRFVLREGRKRQIRRMCELVGLSVVGLKRVRIGKVALRDLPLGQWRYLADDESFA